MNDDKVEILIVDDEQGIVDLLGQVLELSGYAVRPVCSAAKPPCKPHRRPFPT